MEKLLEVKDLKVNFHSYGGEVQAVRGVKMLLILKCVTNNNLGR